MTYLNNKSLSHDDKQPFYQDMHLIAQMIFIKDLPGFHHNLA